MRVNARWWVERTLVFSLLAGFVSLGLLNVVNDFVPVYSGENLSPELAASPVPEAEMAFADMAADAGVESYADFFLPEEFADVHKRIMYHKGLDAFAAATSMYTTVFRALVTSGNQAASKLENYNDFALGSVIDPSRMARLASHYRDPGAPPWPDSFCVFAGPYPTSWGETVLRIRGAEGNGPGADRLTVTLPDGVRVGFPAPAGLPIYMWSFGRNCKSDQALFDATGEYLGDPISHYRSRASDAVGGGDDENNWDAAQTWTECDSN